MKAISPSPAMAPARPQSPASRLQRGIAAFQAGRFPEAQRLLAKVLEKDPMAVDALHILGLLAARQGRMVEAEGWLRRCIAAAPAYAYAHDNLGNALMAQGRAAEAEACHREALRLAPDYGPAWLNLGRCLRAQGRHEEAESASRQPYTVPPDVLGKRIIQQRLRCDWQAWDLQVPALVERIREGAGDAITPFSAFALPGLMPADLLKVARAYGERYRPWMARGPLYNLEPRPPHDRLRIGYLSGDLRDHATARLTASVFELHDRNQFEIFAYSLAPMEANPMGQRLRAAFEHLTEVQDLNPEQAAQRIREDQIDILVDMHGYTRLSRPEIPAQRPAPIQVSWLAFPGSMGVPFIDYLIADPVVVPPEEVEHYDEALAYLPHCYQPQDPRRQIATGGTRALEGLPADAFVFCCFNRPHKLTPDIFTLWCDLLRDLPQAILWLFDPQSQARDNLRREAAKRGVGPERLVFADHVPQDRHLARIGLADLFLDTSPYNAHTTASDALWAGVPVLTRPGQTFASRVAASLLTAAGLPEWIARDWPEYARLARHLATTPAALTECRRKLQARRNQAPLFDALGYTRALEELYQRMWRRRQAALPPATLDPRETDDL